MSTERRDADLFRLVFDLAPIPAGITRIETGELLHANQALLEILDRDASEVVGRSVLEVGVWASPEHRREVMERVQREGRARNVELEVRRRDGSRRLVLAAFDAIATDGERWVVGAFQDITTRAQAETAQRHSEQRLQAILTATGEGIFGLDRSGRVTFANPAADQMLGYDPGALTGTEFHAVAHHSRPDGTGFPLDQCPIHAAIIGGAVVRTDREVFWTADGSALPVEYRANPLVLEEATVGAVITFDEVSGRLAAQRALEGAREEAERANAAKTQFLSHMSHELRTPLNSVLGFAELLAMRDLPDDAGGDVHQIQRAGRHLLNLIDDALDISRIESGGFDLSLEPVGVDEVLAESVALVEPTAEEAEIELRWSADTDLFVRADSKRLRQVLLNLLSNAIKYNRPGGEVVVSARTGSDDRVAIEVADTGRGISPERLPRIFKPFERVAGDSSGVEGTGLGLALSRGLAEMMGGAVDVDSVEGSGTTFTVTLESAPARRPGSEAVRKVSAPGSVVRGSALLLYIEDNPANIRLLEAALRTRPDVDLLVATEGAPGVETAVRERPDLVLVDLHLPDLNGEEVVVRLREAEETRDTRVIVVSADAGEERIRRLREVGADDYFTKPIDVARLLREVDRLLRPVG